MAGAGPNADKEGEIQISRRTLHYPSIKIQKNIFSKSSFLVFILLIELRNDGLVK